VSRIPIKLFVPLLFVLVLGLPIGAALSVSKLSGAEPGRFIHGSATNPGQQAVSFDLTSFGLGAKPTYVQAAPNATATPTPFQPLAPTAQLAQMTQMALSSLEVTVIPERPTVFAPEEMAPTATPLPTSTPLPAPDTALTPEPEMEKLPSQINVLLLGADRRPWESGFRTDTIILLTINTDLGRVNITSFPRDLWLMLPGWGMSRINTAWTYGGYKMLKDTFKYNFGIEVDYHVLIDFGAFKKIVDSLGGLDVKVGETVSDYRGGYWVTIKKGLQRMDADDVLWYVRTRKTTNDIARNRRQQEVLQALFDKFVSMDAIKHAPELWDLYDHSVKTDVGLVDVLKWLPFAAKITETRDIHQYFITYNEVYDSITAEGAMVLVPNKPALMKVIRQSQNIK